jgi:acetyl/propionyl-CoA carboxylase alpha subunit/acetyl-CoA carboxylase carboxyltransferase component
MSFRRIAIVNRGDAASRCVRAVRELREADGVPLTSIALYTEPERSAPFVQQADEALSLGAALRGARGGAPRLAYLDRARVLAALRASRADAVWPGWGFLAEDARFVEQLEQRALTFVGPSSSAMRALGDKIAAKRLAESCAVPVIAWSGGPVGSEDLAEHARTLGLPLLLKASAGGGGRGIRRVEEWNELSNAFARAQAEALHAFGDGTIFLEAAVSGARHIEVQIAADMHGGCLALGLRDCSLQRRHQKLIEEAPPPHLDCDVADALRAAAVRLARAAAYTGVGTVEFLLAADGRTFFFLEVNPRLQVEHALTEMLTDVDLVGLQLRLARGDALPSTAPPERGHAIEARVCAEDPAADFAPSPGTVVLFEVPGGPGVRVDSAVGLGSALPAEFDQLLVKVIAHAPTREAALARLARALHELQIVLVGGATNKGLLLDLLANEAVRRGGLDVEGLDRLLPTLPPPARAAEALMTAAILAYQEERARVRLNFFAEAAGGAPRAVPSSEGQTIELIARGQTYRLHVLAIGDWSYRIGLDGRECVARLLEQTPHACQLLVGERRYGVTVARADDATRIEVDGRPHLVSRETGGVVRASAPAVVVALDVAVGDAVQAGQRLGLLETMKVEVPFCAPCAGTVRAVHVRRNERVAAGAPLVQIHAAGTFAVTLDGCERIALPEWSDPLLALFTESGEPDLDDLARLDVVVRERAWRSLTAAVRRVLLGYDQRLDLDAQVDALLTAQWRADLDPTVLAELAAVCRAIGMFADTEVLFSRDPEQEAGGVLAPSNDAWVRLYLRRIGSRGAGLPESFLALLRRAMAHYGLGDLPPGDAQERALLRLFAAQRRAEKRYRVSANLLALLARLAPVVDLAGDSELAVALGTCIRLRGTVPDELADAATEARYVIFELPEIARRTALATSAVERLLSPADTPGVALPGIDILFRLAESPPALFECIAPWTRASHPGRRALALQALVLRQYASTITAGGVRCDVQPDGAGVCEDGSSMLRFALAAGDTVLAALMPIAALPERWEDLCATASREQQSPLIELFLVADSACSTADVSHVLDALLARRRPRARQLCCTALQPDGVHLHVTFADDGQGWTLRGDLYGLHPETARRIGVARLAEFALERLPSSREIYAFHGRSRRIEGDERIFIFGEVRAAVPGTASTLHEPAFVDAFGAAVRALRVIRSERDQGRRLHWNRITLVVRPALFLSPSTLDRLLGELAPATRHLGLEKIVIRLSLRERPDGGVEQGCELVLEPTVGGRLDVAWRDPHDLPLQPATETERRIVQARRRGVVYPYEAIRLFSLDGAHFAEYDLAPGDGPPLAISVGDRAAGLNCCGIVFGLMTTPTAKHPEGMRRVLVLSDPTHDMGALAAAECDRLVAALDFAALQHLPLEWVATSSGARIAMDSGTENLDATARVVRRIVRFTAAGGEINIIVAGVNVGAQSYFDALSTMLVHTRGILVMMPGAAMVLTGRAALEASGGIAAEDEVGIGGFERTMGPNGQAQYYAPDLRSAYEILLQHYEFTYRAPGERSPRPFATRDLPSRSIAAAPYPAEEPADFATVGAIFDDATNPDRKRPFAIRPVMQALIDTDGGWLERWTAMAGAESAIVWDTHLGGHAICLIGIESRNLPRLGARASDGPAEWTAGTLFPLAAKKIARALHAASGVRPAVILANLSGFDGSPESLRLLQLEYGAEIARAVVEFAGAVLFVVLARYHGGAYVVFSRALNDDLAAVALEGAYASVIGGSAAASVVFARAVRAAAEADPRLQSARAALQAERDPDRAAALRMSLDQLAHQVALERHSETARAFDAVHTVERARAVGSLDEIIPVADLRRRLIERLSAARA